VTFLNGVYTRDGNGAQQISASCICFGIGLSSYGSGRVTYSGQCVDQWRWIRVWRCKGDIRLMECQIDPRRYDVAARVQKTLQFGDAATTPDIGQ
jgi:hypothetical protein